MFDVEDLEYKILTIVKMWIILLNEEVRAQCKLYG